MKLFRSIVAVLLLSAFLTAPVLLVTSCSTTSSLTEEERNDLLAPEKLYAGIVLLSAGVISKVSPSDKALVSQFAVGLGQLTDATVDSDAIADLLPDVSSEAEAFINPILNAAIEQLNLALKRFGSHNAQIVAYTSAISHGLKDGGFHG
jgi:hypothetical protein